MHEIHLITLAVTAANILILAFLAAVYARNYMHIKSHCNLGFLIFTVMFVLQNLLATYFVYLSWDNYNFDLFISFLGALNSIQFVGLLSLLYVTWK